MKPDRKKLALLRMPRPEASSGLFAVLDDMHDLAIQGRITSFGCVMTMKDGESSFSYHLEKNSPMPALLGEIDLLKDRLISRMKDWDESE